MSGGKKKGKQMGMDNYNYVFSNDMTDADMGISAAQHDCKLVFDSIIDDRSFQEADAGLVLYYANQIMYALDKVSEKDDYNKGYQEYDDIEADSEEEAFIIASDAAMQGGSWYKKIELIENEQKKD